MKTLTSRLPWLLCGALTCGLSNASATNDNWLSSAEFIQSVSLSNQAENKADNKNKQRFLAVSEAAGVALLNEDGRVLSSIPTKSEHLDFRWLPNTEHQGVVATLDVNTGAIQLINVNFANNELSVAGLYAPKNTAIDALCLGSTEKHLELFTVDVRGEVNQMVLTTSIDRNWQLKEVNRFPVGLNMKSCAVNDQTNTLFITEENIGIWQYSTNPEHEIIRTLSQLPEGLEVEYVDTTAAGDVAVVSPSIDRVWLLDHSSNAFKPLPLAKGAAPKTVQLVRNGKALSAYVFDDEKEVASKVELGQHAAPVVKSEHASQIASLPAYAQTDPVVSYGDAADDPEIWVNKHAPAQSLVYGTDKKSGLNVYDLNGKLLKAMPVGRVNNVDIRYNVTIDDEVVDIAAASNRTNKSISLFSIDQQSGLPTLIADIQTDLADPYGLCMGKYGNDLAVWINDTDGRFQKYDIAFSGKKASGTKSMEWMVPSQPEGCVSDDAGMRLFYGEESTGIWLKALNSNRNSNNHHGKSTNEPDTLIAGLNKEVAADIEGMSLYVLSGKNYLVVSSQGNNRYAVYAVDDGHKYLGVFEVGANWSALIDGASETDGLAVTSQNLGSQLPHGLLVVQDGHKVMPKTPQNFKLVKGTLLRDWILARTQNES